MQHRPSAIMPDSRRAGSSLFVTDGMIRSGTRPWKTELLCSGCELANRPRLFKANAPS